MESEASTSDGAETPQRREAIVRLVAILTVLGCVFIPSEWRRVGREWNAAAVALIGLVTILLLREGNTDGLGLRIRPLQGWGAWYHLAIRAGIDIAAVITLFVSLSVSLNWPLTILRVPPSYALQQLLLLCLFAPVVEELVYRSLLSLALRPTVGDTGTIVASGFVFAAIHHLSGNPSPENQIAGFLFAWAYLRSETILVPIAMHAAGNALAALSHVANWHLFPPPVP